MNLENTLRKISSEFSPAALASSMQAEDMVLIHAVAQARLPIGIFVLDTWRLHADTLSLIQETTGRFGVEVRIYEPEPAAVLQYVKQHGRDAFYDSVELRQRCCHIRKVEPLSRALAGQRAWISGQRRDQSTSRAELAEREFDAVHRIEKFNPLASWSEAQIWEYLRQHRVPYNRLHDQGYRSIGCAPCTRPVLPGEDARAGRWWWEQAERKECGLHAGNGASDPIYAAA